MAGGLRLESLSLIRAYMVLALTRPWARGAFEFVFMRDGVQQVSYRDGGCYVFVCVHAYRLDVPRSARIQSQAGEWGLELMICMCSHNCRSNDKRCGRGWKLIGRAHGKSKVFNVDVSFPIHSNSNAFLDIVV